MSARQISSEDMLPFNTGWPAGSYRAPANLSLSASSAPPTSALATFLPFIIPKQVTIDRIGLYLSTPRAGAECRLGLYADDDGAPGSLILDAGVIDLSSGSAMKELTISLDQSAGLIWSCCQLKSVATQVTLIRMGAAVGEYVPMSVETLLAANGTGRYYKQDITYGSPLPSTAGAVTAEAGTAAPVIILRSA